MELPNTHAHIYRDTHTHAHTKTKNTKNIKGKRKKEDITTISKPQSFTSVRIKVCALRLLNQTTTVWYFFMSNNKSNIHLFIYKYMYLYKCICMHICTYTRRVLTDFRWCIRHNSSMQKSAGLYKFGFSAGPWFEAETPSTQINVDVSKQTLKQVFETIASSIKVGLGISWTNVDSQWNPVYSAFHRDFCCANQTIRR